MQQIRAYKDGSKRWVIVIEDSDASLDEFVSGLIKDLSNASAEPVKHLDEPKPMAAPKVDYSVLEEVKAEMPAAPSFVTRIKEEEAATQEAEASSKLSDENRDITVPQSDISDKAKEPELPSSIVSKETDGKTKTPETDDIREFLRNRKDDKKLKDIIMRRYHTSDIEQVLSQRPQRELELLKKQAG